MRWTELEPINTIISAVGVLASLLAVFVAFRTSRAQYRLDEKIANQSGRLHSVNINLAYDTEDTYGHTELVAVNGPSDITITDIELELTYYHPVGFFGRTASKSVF